MKIKILEIMQEIEFRKPAKSFQELIVWQKAHQYVLEIYKYTSSFPNQEIFGLVSQMRRAAVSIAANIAEGFGKKGFKDKIRFLNIAQGSLEEAKYYIILSADLNYGDNKHLAELLTEIAKLLNSYSKAILASNS